MISSTPLCFSNWVRIGIFSLLKKAMFGFGLFSLPSPPFGFSWHFTLPVCIRARTYPTGTLSGISKITIFTAFTFFPSSIVLAVLKKETNNRVNSAFPLNKALLLFNNYLIRIIGNLRRGYVLSLPHNYFLCVFVGLFFSIQTKLLLLSLSR